MESASSIAIGSSMIESGLRASFARTRKVSSAVSETPVSTVPSPWPSERHSFQNLVDSAQVAGSRRRLVALLAHRLPDRGVQRAGLGHLPVDDAPAPFDLLVRPGLFGERGEFVEHVLVGDEGDVGMVALDLALERVGLRYRCDGLDVVGKDPGVVSER